MTTPIWKIFAVTATGGVAVAGVVLLANAGFFGRPAGEAVDPGLAVASEAAGTDAPARAALPATDAPEQAADTAGEAAPVGLPAFDVVRIEPDGTAVIAGMAAPGSAVALMLNGEEIARAEADGSGRFVAFLSLEPSEAPRLLALVADPDGTALRSDETVVVSPFAAPDVQVAAVTAEPEAEPPVEDPVADEDLEPVEGAVAQEAPQPVEVAEAASAPEPPVAVAEAAPAPETPVEVAEAEQAPVTQDPVEIAALDTAPDADPNLPAPDQDADIRLELDLGPAEDFEVAADATPAADPAEVAEATPEPQPVAEATDTAPIVAEAEPEASAPAVDVSAALSSADVAPLDSASQPSVDASPAVPETAPTVVSDAPAIPAAPSTTADGVALAAETGEPPQREDPGLDVALSAAEPSALGDATAPGAPVSAELSAPSLVEPVVATGSVATLSDPGAVQETDLTAQLLAPDAPESGPSPDPSSAPAPDTPEVPASLAEAPSDAPAPAPTAPSVFVADSEGVRILQPAGGETAPDVMSNVALDTITYDEVGDVVVGGRGNAEGFVRIYLDNQPVTVSRIAEDGQWRIGLPDVDTGIYTLRVDEVSASGDVLSRIETPFLRESPETLARVMAEETSRAGFNVAVKTVQPGHTLWAIAEERYGDGILYVRVFEANRDLIRDPNMIFPGQVFRLPEEGQEG